MFEPFKENIYLVGTICSILTFFGLSLPRIYKFIKHRGAGKGSALWLLFGIFNILITVILVRNTLEKLHNNYAEIYNEPTTVEVTPKTNKAKPQVDFKPKPTEKEIVIALYYVLGSAEKTVGWDNVYAYIAIDKSTALLAELICYYDEGTYEYKTYVQWINDLKELRDFLKSLFDDTEIHSPDLNPTGTKAKSVRNKIREIRIVLKRMNRDAFPLEKPYPVAEP